jgi:para-nitrobenzyl esterase
VLVTINYRLNAFGFLALPELGARDPRGVSGNYGILDQQLALRWVHQNIAHFGTFPRYSVTPNKESRR